MWLSDTSVKRPVFATVLSLMLLAIGALSFRDLTVREYPDTVQPTVQVQVGYPGASSEIIETRITQVLEAELSGIEGVKNFIGLFDEISAEGGVGLLAVPGTTAGSTKTGHDGGKFGKGRTRVFGEGRFFRAGWFAG